MKSDFSFKLKDSVPWYDLEIIREITVREHHCIGILKFDFRLRTD